MITMSNIAWTVDEEPVVAKLLAGLGVRGVEVAPTKIWPDLTTVTADQAAEYRAFWNGHGIDIVAMQSMLYGHLDLTIFDDEFTRGRTRAYLEKSLVLAGRLGVQRLVFGSPKNRHVGPDGPEAAWAVAVEFFRHLGGVAHDEGAILCLEPNPEAYNCDFATTSDVGLKLVQEVDSPGFGLHLDAAGMHLAKEDPVEAAGRHVSHICHFHLSAPYLGHVDRAVPIDYAAILHTLHEGGYDRWTSIEMRPQPDGTSNVPFVTESLGYLLSM